MSYESESDLKYIGSLGDLPIGGPDDFSEDEKLQAAAAAESRLESDVNDGAVIADGDREQIHADTAAAYATYRLFVGPEHPEAQRSGSLAGGSAEDLMEMAREFKSMYDEGVGSINSATQDAGGEDADTVRSSLI